MELTSSLTADYWYRDGPLIAETATGINGVVDNFDLPHAILFLAEDVRTIDLDSAEDLIPWIGSGTIDLEAIALLTGSADPVDVVDLFLGGVVRYRVTFDYEEVPWCPTDLDRNDRTDGGDIGAFFASWGICNGCDADFNQDGMFDGIDLGRLVSAWGDCR